MAQVDVGAARLATHAAKQHGLITWDQIASTGCERRVRSWVARGWVERLGRGLYAFSSTPATWPRDALAACLRGGPACVTSHQTAASLLGMGTFSPRPIHVLVREPLKYRDPRRGVVVHRTAELPDSDIDSVEGIPVTNAVRTLIDLAAFVPERVLEEVFDAAERDGLVSTAAVAERHAAIRRSGRNGIRRLATLLERRAMAHGLPTSVLEREMLRVLARHNLPMPVCQFAVRRADGRVAYVDHAYPEVRTGFEVDGHVSHATRTERGSDAERDNELSLVDWVLRRFTWEQVQQRPGWVARIVRQTLLQRGADLHALSMARPWSAPSLATRPNSA